MDLAGEDDYEVACRTNNSEYCSFGHGIHLDMEWDGGDVIGEVANPLPPYEEFALPRMVIRSDYYAYIKALQNQDNFIRFLAVGRIVNAGPEMIPALTEALIASNHRQFNRDCMECIHYFFVTGKVTGEYVMELTRLLDAPDPEVRTLMADNFGVFRIEEAEDALISALDDEKASVRWFALRSLASLKSQRGAEIAGHLAFSDLTEDVRRTAVYYITRVDTGDDIYPILCDRLVNDSASSVRVAATSGIGNLQREEGIEPLREAALGNDVYVKRAVGKALAELYQIEGVEILINSLSFPSIDAFDNYNRNVPNLIAAYCGHDLDTERYNLEAWQSWFEAHKDSIDIHYNVDSYREFTKLSEELADLPDTLQISRLEEFLENYPTYQTARKTLAETLNRVAWYLAVDAKNTSEFDPLRAIRYSDRAVELDPQANYIDTQAEANLAAGNLDKAEEICKQALERWPGNTMFTERLARINKLK